MAAAHQSLVNRQPGCASRLSMYRTASGLRETAFMLSYQIRPTGCVPQLMRTPASNSARSVTCDR